MEKYKFIKLSFVVLSTLICRSIFIYGSSFNGTENIINPAVINNAGLHGITSLNYELFNSIGEISVSTFTSNSFYLYSGMFQTPAYPSTITDLTANPETNEGELTLLWTAPGADGIIGNCYEYDIRYSTDITDSPALSEEKYQSCDSVSKFSPIPSPYSYGTEQSLTITGLEPGTTYYFAVKSRNYNYNWAFLSNGATSWAKIGWFVNKM